MEQIPLLQISYRIYIPCSISCQIGSCGTLLCVWGGGEIGDSAGIVYRVHRLVLWDFEEVWCSSGA